MIPDDPITILLAQFQKEARELRRAAMRMEVYNNGWVDGLIVGLRIGSATLPAEARDRLMIAVEITIEELGL